MNRKIILTLLFILIVGVAFFVFHNYFNTDHTIKNKKDKPVVYFYNWTEYVPSGLLNQFTQETGIKVIYATYTSDDMLYAKLKTNPKAYDLVVPSAPMVAKMRREDMLHLLNKTQLKNYKYLDPSLLDKPFDPGNKYSIPYMWGATLIAVNHDLINPNTIHSWGDLWDPKFKNQVMLLDDERDVFQMALIKNNLPSNSRDPAQLAQVYEDLKKLMPNVVAFNSDNPALPYVQGDVNIGMIWNGSAYVAIQSGAPLSVIWPKEGGIFWMDNLAIPKNAQHVSAAMKLINFLLRPDVAAKVAQKIGYPTPNLLAQELLPKSISQSKILYPSKEEIKRAHWQNDVGFKARELYETYFEKLKNSGN